ncbi:MAG: hypothetical protein KGJ13_07450 [Patescibacteria group bacterium]|nr:hypothetical protein [Patescibacteria group bacterium]
MPTAFAQTLGSSTAAIASATAKLGTAALSDYFSALGTLQVISVIITIFLVVAIIYIIAKTGWLRSRVEKYRTVVLKTDLSQKRAKEGWELVQKHFFAGDDNDLKIAVIQADTILEEALRHAGTRGTNLGDRLKNLKRGQMPNLEDVWQAHKLRNQIAHEPVLKVKRDTAERALDAYREALKNLGALD